jgi:hypothetical protein
MAAEKIAAGKIAAKKKIAADSLKVSATNL